MQKVIADAKLEILETALPPLLVARSRWSPDCDLDANCRKTAALPGRSSLTIGLEELL